MKNNTLGIFGFGLAFVASLVGGTMYANVNNQLTSTKMQLQTLQQERDKKSERINKQKQKIQEKEEKLRDNEQKIEDREKEINRLRQQIEDQRTKAEQEAERLREQTRTVSVCLDGVVKVMKDISNDNKSAALIDYGAVKKECGESGKILREIKN